LSAVGGASSSSARSALEVDPQLEDLAEQHQRGDDGRRLVVHADLARVIAEGRRENVWQQCRDEAEQVGDRDPETDQGEHVEIAGPERLPRALEEGPAAPEHHRGSQHQLHPLRAGRIDEPVEADARRHVAHGIDEQRQGEDRADPEATGHVDQFRVGAVVEADRFGLQRHSADRAAPRSDLTDFRVHRTSIDGAGGHVLDLVEVRAGQVVAGISDELVLAPGGAEEMGRAVMLGDMGRVLDRHAHPAHGVDRGALGLAIGRLVRVAATHRLPPRVGTSGYS
jgi:hypothetical protein